MIVPFGGNLIMGDPLVFSNEDLNEITARTQEAIEKMAQDLSDSNQI
jgi:adenosylmethionine-8-amino-7-oxononanoate aminotransferase